MLEDIVIICLEKLAILPINKFIFIEYTLGTHYLAREPSHGHHLSLYRIDWANYQTVYHGSEYEFGCSLSSICIYDENYYFGNHKLGNLVTWTASKSDESRMKSLTVSQD